MERYPDDVKNIVAHGHELGNHTLDHPELSKLSAQQVADELNAAHQRVRDLTGIEMCLFRAPYGDYDNKVIDTAKAAGYYGLQWTIDSWDWMNRGSADIIDRVLNSKSLDGGAIILMHNGAADTPGALETVISGLLAKGYEIVPVSRLIYTENYHMNGAGTQIAN